MWTSEAFLSAAALRMSLICMRSSQNKPDHRSRRVYLGPGKAGNNRSPWNPGHCRIPNPMVTNPLPYLLIAYGVCLAFAVTTTHQRRTRFHSYWAGRALSLPALIATMVTTWYGGILGVGEYAWRFGVSTWVVFGLPYYIAAVVFGMWLAPRLRKSNAVSIPDLLGRTYGRRVALTGAAGVWAGTIPVAYLLMLATLIHQATGCPLALATLVGAGFSCWYVGVSGFRAVVRTDVFQMALMFGGSWCSFRQLSIRPAASPGFGLPFLLRTAPGTRWFGLAGGFWCGT